MNLSSTPTSGALIIPAVKNTSSLSKNLIYPLHIGDASFHKLRTITTTPLVKSSTNPKPTVVIMNNNLIKSEPQQPTMTVNRLLLSNNTTTTNPTINNGQNTINLATLVNNLNTLNQIALLQNVTPQNSISKLLETPINVVQQSTSSLPQKSNFPKLYFHFTRLLF
jgi:hypothetical protein